MKHIENSEIKRTLVYIVLITLTVFSLFPFFVLIVNATRTHAQIMKGFSPLPGLAFFSNLGHLLSNPNIPVLRALGNSILVSVMSAVLTTYFSAMTAYGIFMYNFKGKQFAFKLILALMMIPTQVSTLGFIRLLIKIKMIDTLAALYIPAIASPVVFFYMYQAMQSSLPYSIVEAARIDGCNEIRIFNTIVIPLMKPAIAVQMIFSFVNSWNNYFVPALVINSKLKKTIPIMIAQLRSADYQKFDMAQVYMFICLAIIPLVIVYLFLSRSIISGVSAGSVKE
ncbi:MAG: carbohydrate ABC transporter permease [Spirochaetia bacterium]|nr:carbohydrate ABC transporter permease [Treponema sp.]MCI6316007.1 carbohydrate ABC transporter permease [Spirochaetia bacterium]MEE1251120.1 carbohydrate ABC transporter permease [Lachnospiraceae bacterium]MBR0544858.1 carbohydrate ABC transporter permease [Treponema sp.]MCI6366016.1 carbohydrate ABC transporter permease [Spirochaetia bacterium]